MYHEKQQPKAKLGSVSSQTLNLIISFLLVLYIHTLNCKISSRKETKQQAWTFIQELNI